MKYYYLLWSDAIERIQRFNPNMKGWKWSVFVTMTMIHSLVIWNIVIWLKYFGYVSPIFDGIDFFPGRILNGFLSYVLEFMSIIGIINYFLVFYKDKYKKIVNSYNPKDSNVFLRYLISVCIITFVNALVYPG